MATTVWLCNPGFGTDEFGSLVPNSSVPSKDSDCHDIMCNNEYIVYSITIAGIMLA